MPAELVRGWPFRLCLGVAALAAAGLIFMALDSVFQPVGLRSGPVDDPRPDHLGMALLMACTFVAIRLLLLNQRGTRLACFALLWVAYLTTVGVTSCWRHSAIEALAALSH